MADAANNTGLVADCDVLLSVRDSLRGTGALNWAADRPIGEWDGVTVLGGRVAGLSLWERGLTGVIPAGLGELGRLARLDLRRNQLTDPVPASLGNLSQLRVLVLLGNRLTDSIPSELGDLGALRTLDLSGNELTGSIPSGLAELESLTELRLNGNALTASIPSELGDLSGLELLYLQENELTGAVPSELGGLSGLKELRLNSNGLTGAIPPEVGGLGKLELLFLHHNALTGAVPSELGDLGSLRTLFLGDNRLTGSIPPELGDLDSLSVLSMRDNRLTGSIPPELGDLASLTELLLHSNRLTGEIPLELGELENLTLLYLFSNQLTGAIPGSLTRLGSLSSLSLRYNRLDGCVPSALHEFKATINPQSGGSVVADCRPDVHVDPTEGLVTLEGSDRGDFFWVLLGDSPSTDVRIPLHSSDPGEGVMHQKELLFTPRDWYVRRMVGVYGVDDAIRDGPQEYTAVLEMIESTDPRWRGTDPADVQVTNLDNEGEGVPRIEAFEAYPHTIPAGGETMLYWLVDRAASIRIEPGVGTVTEDSVAVSPEATTTYTLTAANFDGETTAEATVTVVSDVSVEAFRAVPDSVTRGGMARLEWEVVGAESVYIGDVDVTDSTYLAVAPEATTTYALAAVNALGDSAMAEVTVTVVPPAEIERFEAEPDTVAQGHSARLEWAIEGAESVFIDGADVTDSAYLAVAPEATTTYSLAAVNVLGDGGTAEVTVTVVPPPSIASFAATPDSVTRGDTARLEWEVEGADSVFVDGADVTDSTYLAVAPEATTTYTLTAKNRVGGVTQTAVAAATLTVVPRATITMFEAEPDSVTRGDMARLEWEVEDAESVFIDGADVTDSTYLAVAPETTTTYEMAAVNALGDSATAEVTVTVAVNSPPEAHIAISGCDAGNYNCTYDASGSTDPEDNIESYSWDMGDDTVLDGVTVAHGYGAPGRYTVTLTVTDSVGATGAADTVRVVNLAPEADFTAACEELACTFTSTATDDGGIETWAWDFGDDETGSDSVAIHTYAAGGSYDVTLTVADGLGAGGDATRTVVAAPRAVIDTFWAVPDTITRGDTARLMWNIEGADSVFLAPDIGNVTDSTGVDVVPETTGTYTLAVVNATGDSTTAETTVTVVPPPAVVSFTADRLVVTSGDTVTLSWRTESAQRVSISPNPGAGQNLAGSAKLTPRNTTTYRITATNPVGATASATLTVSTVPPPVIEAFNARPTTINRGESSTLVWGTTGADSLFIDRNVGVVTDRTSVDVRPSATTTYTLTATNAADSSVNATASVTVVSNYPPVASFTYRCPKSGGQAHCTFTSESTDDFTSLANLDHSWGGTASGSGRTAEVTYDSPGTYTVSLTVTDEEGLSDTESRNVVIPNETPTADFTISCDGPRCRFTSTSTDDFTARSDLDHSWGGTASGSGRTAEVTYDSPGRYTVSLTVTDEGGLSDTETKRNGVVIDNETPTADFTISCDGPRCRFTSTSTDDFTSLAPGPQLGRDRERVRADGRGDVRWGGTASGSGRMAEVTYGPGRYTVSLTVTDEGGLSDTENKRDGVVIDNEPPVVIDNETPTDFTISCDGPRCTFTISTSTDDFTSLADLDHSWGGTASGSGRMAEVTYDSPGRYTVSLTVTDEGGLSHTENKRDGVVIPNEAPVADFTISCDGLDCTFTSTSTDDFTSLADLDHSWGGTASGSGRMAKVTYDDPGPHTVSLTVTDEGRRSHTETKVDVEIDNDPPVARFSHDCTGKDCKFYADDSDDDLGIVSYAWVFRPGEIGSGATPIHQYDSHGRYDVRLIVTDVGQLADTVIRPVTVGEEPTADFFFDCASVVCIFTSTATDPDNDLATWDWNFGDNTSGSGISVTHTYPRGGTYTVRHQATDSLGFDDSISKTVTVYSPPLLRFESQCDGLSCTFMGSASEGGDTQSSSNGGKSAGDGMAFEWALGDGATLSGDSVGHEYAAGGSYEVRLTVTDAEGQTGSVSDTVSVNEPPTADFTVSCSALACTFTGTATDDDGIDSYAWTMGDGTSLAGESVSHEYAADGSYEVVLAVTDTGGLSATARKTVAVSAR